MNILTIRRVLVVNFCRNQLAIRQKRLWVGGIKECLGKYCADLPNEGGGGVPDRRPRLVVGTTVVEELGRTVAGLCDRLRTRVTAEEIDPPGGRALAFHGPPSAEDGILGSG
jgi:hypothetical protein